jgi:PAS domain S-box-containing protein
MVSGHMGLTYDDVIGKTDYDFLSKDMADGFYAKEQKIILTGESRICEEVQDKRGTMFSLNTKMPFYNLDGKCLGIVCINHDITERKQAEEALRESAERLKNAQAIGKIGNWEFDINTQEIKWSDQVFELYERDISLGPPTAEEEAAYYSLEQAKILKNYAHRAIEEEKEFNYDLEAKLPSGKIIQFSAQMVPVKDESGRVIKLFGTVQDITERKKAEVALKIAEENYRKLADSISDVFFAMDKNLIYTYWNKASERLTGIEAKDTIGKSIYEVFPDTEQTRRVVSVYQNVLKTQKSQSFVNEYKLQGKTYFFEINAYPSKNGLSVLTKDITKRNKMEKTQEVLYEISKAVHTTANLDELFESIHKSLSAIINTKNFYIALYDRSTDMLSFPYFIDEKDKAFKPFKITGTKSSCENVIKTKAKWVQNLRFGLVSL